MNMIKWNAVTWYSRLGAIVLFIGIVPAVSFYVGTQYELTQQTVEVLAAARTVQ